MDKSESEYKFRESDDFYRQRRYQEALAILEDLDRAHPDTRRVLYPMARCLARLERYADAMELTGRLIDEFEYEPARLLHAKLEKRTQSAKLLNLDRIDEELSGALGFNLGAAPPVLPVESRASSNTNWILGAALIVVLGTLVFFQHLIGFEFTEWLTAVSEQPESIPPVPVGPAIYFGFLVLTLSYIGGCLGGYCGLAVVQALPFTTFEGNLKDVALYVAFGTLLSMIPVLGWIAILIILSRHYELSLGSLMVVVFVYMAVGGLAYYGLTFFVGFAAAII